MDRFTPENFFDLSDFPYAELFQDITNVWETLPKLSDFLRDQFAIGKIQSNYKDKKDVFIGKGTKVYETAEILGPAIIGENCIISHASFIRGNCLLGRNVKIGHAAEIKSSVFLNNSTAAHLNYIGNSIVGNNVNISGGAIFANSRLDKKPVTVRTKDKKIETNLQKLGSIIGDNSNIGVNTVLNPGTILGKNTIIYPLLSVSGVHLDNAVIKE